MIKIVNKVIKVIITIALAIGLLIGSFYGILYVDATFKKTERGGYYFKESETHEIFASKHGYYLPTIAIKRGFEESVFYHTLWRKSKKGEKVNISNLIHFDYFKTTKDENGFEKYNYDRLNNGIFSLRIEVITNPVITWEQEIFRRRELKKMVNGTVKSSLLDCDIEGAVSLGYVSVAKNRQLNEYTFRLYMESRISKECHVKAGVNWIIDIDNYDYDAMTQTALDYMAYIIRNVQPPVE